VSDSTPGAGLADGERYRMGRREYVVADGVGMTLDRASFGGSTTLLPDMIRIAMRAMGIGLAEAVAMASAVPARAAGLDGVGRIAPGHHADLALFTEDLTLKAVALAGQWHQINALSGKEPPR
jgi:N-acetylglucosamine-6-phosphate deacetylase